MAVAPCWACLSKVVAQVPVNDALAGNGTSLPDGDVALAEDAPETEEQSKRRKEAEESFKVHSFVPKPWPANPFTSFSGCTASCTLRQLLALSVSGLATTLHMAA